MRRNQLGLVQPLPRNPTASYVLANSLSYVKCLSQRGWTMVAAYIGLLKIRSAALNAFSALVGLLLATGGGVEWNTALILVVSVGLAAAGSGTLNSYLDRDIDKVMHRTLQRPLPSGRIEPAEKVLYAGILLVMGGLILSVVVLGLLATLFIALGVIIYVFVYTIWLKRKTPWSVVIGGVAGSCALLAGWASASTSFGWLPLLFSIFVFLWTPGHFWGLAIRTKGDNEQANIPTLPTIYGERVASKWVALSNMALVPFSAIPYALGMLGEVYFFISLAIGLVLLISNINLYFTPTAQKAWMVFKLSSLYLATVYIAVLVDIFLI